MVGVRWEVNCIQSRQNEKEQQETRKTPLAPLLATHMEYILSWLDFSVYLHHLLAFNLEAYCLACCKSEGQEGRQEGKAGWRK